MILSALRRGAFRRGALLAFGACSSWTGPAYTSPPTPLYDDAAPHSPPAPLPRAAEHKVVLSDFEIYALGTGDALSLAVEMLTFSPTTYVVAKTYALGEGSYMYKMQELNDYAPFFKSDRVHVATLLGHNTPWLAAGPSSGAGHDKIVVLITARLGFAGDAESSFKALHRGQYLGEYARIWGVMVHNDNLSNSVHDGNNLQAGLLFMAKRDDIEASQKLLAELAHTMMAGAPCDHEFVAEARKLIGKDTYDETKMMRLVKPPDGPDGECEEIARRKGSKVHKRFAAAMCNNTGIDKGTTVLPYKARWEAPAANGKRKQFNASFCCKELAALSYACKALALVVRDPVTGTCAITLEKPGEKLSKAPAGLREAKRARHGTSVPLWRATDAADHGAPSGGSRKASDGSSGAAQCEAREEAAADAEWPRMRAAIESEFVSLRRSFHDLAQMLARRSV